MKRTDAFICTDQITLRHYCHIVFISILISELILKDRVIENFRLDILIVYNENSIFSPASTTDTAEQICLSEICKEIIIQ